jgi:L-2-hydroxyglutarate oxidase
MRNDGVVVIGGGIVGLAVAVAVKERLPQIPVTVLEKEPILAAHASGRNSGVLHAGFYYSPDSLKARFTREGNAALTELLRTAGRPVRRIGKVVVAREASEIPALEELARRGRANGVELELLPAWRLPEHEPLARTVEAYLWSPTTSVAVPADAVNALAARARSAGVTIRLGSSAEVRADGTVRQGVEVLRPVHLVNAAGAQADRIAQTLGHNDDYLAMPFLGRYLATAQEHLPLQRLVYPVPDSEQPFLGVHLTVTAQGSVKIGPTAIPSVGREQYELLHGWSVKDARDSARATWALVRGQAPGMVGLAKTEAARLFTRRLVSDASQLVPAVREVKNWTTRPPGIRAQLVHLPTGRLEMDFLVRGDETSTHVLNAVSPGWTSAVPFGAYVAERALTHLA